MTKIYDFLVWPTLRKRVFCVRCYIIKLDQIVKPSETTFIVVHLFIFFMPLLLEQRQGSCLLSLNLSNLLQFALRKLSHLHIL